MTDNKPSASSTAVRSRGQSPSTHRTLQKVSLLSAAPFSTLAAASSSTAVHSRGLSSSAHQRLPKALGVSGTASPKSVPVAGFVPVHSPQWSPLAQKRVPKAPDLFRAKISALEPGMSSLASDIQQQAPSKHRMPLTALKHLENTSSALVAKSLSINGTSHRTIPNSASSYFPISGISPQRTSCSVSNVLSTTRNSQRRHTCSISNTLSNDTISPRKHSRTTERPLSTTNAAKTRAARALPATSLCTSSQPSRSPTKAKASHPAGMLDDAVAAAPPNSKAKSDPLAKYDFDYQSTLVFPRITATVKSQPRSTNHRSPSWYEKILLYDPIVLEDFTAWLNRQGITWTVKNAVKAKKSRGRPKKDNGKGDAKIPAEQTEEAVESTRDGEGAEPTFEEAEVSLEVWMVQRWCESKSICCLRRDGERGGPKLNY